jgi:tRNA(fMet)-specific endonuclease VapC
VTVLHMLDTDTASYILRGRSHLVAQRLAEVPPSSVCISAVTQAELLYGLRSLSADHRLHRAVEQFLHMLHILAWDGEAARWYADIRYRLKTTGQPICEMDTMIAAHAIAAGATLVSNNTRHFGRIDAPLTLVNWTAD